MYKSFINKIRDLLIFTIIFILFWKYFSLLDPHEMLDYEVFLWDSGIYKELAENFYKGNYISLQGAYPWGNRILFPFIYANLASIFGLSLSKAAYLINLSSTYLCLAITFFIWRRNKLPQSLCWIGIMIFLAFFGGPLRVAGVYPGGSFAFEMLLIILLFLILQISHPNKIYLIIIGVFLSFMSTGREFVTYVLMITIAIKIACHMYFSKYLNKSKLLNKLLIDTNKISIYNLVVLFAFSLIGYVFARYIVADSDGQYSLFRTILTFTWFHLNIGEIFYVLFCALGPFFLSFVIVFLQPKLRIEFIHNLCEKNINLGLLFSFILSGIIFMLVGGTDSDRFLLWFFPFYGYFGLIAVDVIFKQNNQRWNYSLVLIFISGLLWTRFYVPAIPHLFFPGDSYRSMAGIKTNYDPKFYFGIPFMEKFRLPLKTLSENEVSYEMNSPMIPVSTPKINDNLSPFQGAYQYEINNIPAPFGFTHNQYELLITHPWHGNNKIKAIILFQWFLILILILFINRKSD